MNGKSVEELSNEEELVVEVGEEEGSDTRKKQTEGEEDSLNKDIEQAEVERALRRLRRNKAAGEDGIPGEFLKNLPEGWKGTLKDILNELWKEGKTIGGWKTAKIYPIHKGGEKNETGNYRGVSLLDIGYKVLTNIMNVRLRDWLEKNNGWRESQAGFRRNRSTRDHIFTLNSIIGNKLRKKKGRLYIAYIDFKTAFDVIDRRILLEKLEKKG